MLFLLDTNSFSDLMSDRPRLNARLATLSSSDRVVTCTIVRGEVLHGIARLPDGKRKRTLLNQANALFKVAPCDLYQALVADRYAEIKLSRQRKGTPLDENDLWIAATALALGATLVTRDTDFAQVEGLQIENWAE